MMQAQASTSTTPPPALVAALKRAQERNRELETFIRWEDELFANPYLSGNHKLEIRATRRAVERAQIHDEQGRSRINLTTIAEHIGVSPDTMGRGLKVLEQCGVIASHALKPEVQENGERWTRHYVTLNEEVLKRPKDIKPPEPRNHGGNRYRCQKCGSSQVRIRRRVTVVCTCCQYENVIEESERDQDPADDEPPEQTKNFAQPEGNLPDTLKPVSPPYGLQDAPAGDGPGLSGGECEEEREQDDLRAAAELLLAVAGESEEHIAMARRGEKKYYTVDRPLALDDVLDHLQGGKARGALCSRADGWTRGLCWDGDDAECWAILEQAARQLAEAGYAPLLEPSPVGRGGHLWLLYDGLVEAQAARQQVYGLAPQLAQLAEYWPGPHGARRWNKVRLPGGKYARPGVNAWCQLISVTDGEISTDGRSAARLLLAHQTPVSIVPAIPSHNDQARADERTGGEPERPAVSLVVREEAPASDQEAESARRLGELDSQWYAKYNTPEGARLWFAWTPRYLATWWNNRHSVDELLPSERNGYGLASWRSERTASVAKRGDQWADFGASARQSDGSPDTGDALELQVRLSRAPKPEVMRQAAKELLEVAREALESAARNGAPLPSWLEEIITDAGRAHYARVAAEAGHVDQARAILPQDRTALTQQLQVGDLVTWRHQPPGGYGYVYPVDGEVVSIGPVKVRIRAQRKDGSHKDIAVKSEYLILRCAQPSVHQQTRDAQQGGLTGFSTRQQDDTASKMPPGVEGLGRPALAVPSSSLQAEMQQLEAIKQYGERREWAALLIDGVEIIPAGRPSWLRFLWLSGEKEKQHRVYEYIRKGTG
jgi:DNA-binding transcriptional ArsR family regulator